MQVGAKLSDTEALAEPDPWADVTDERNKLLAVLEEYQSEQKSEPGVEKINVRDCSWPQVMILIRSAENQYKNEKVTGVFGKFRKCLRTLGDNGAIFENWLRILPDGDYGSIISGSFHVIIKVSFKTVKTFALGSAYDKTLVDSIKNIRVLAKKIKEQASQCLQERVCRVDQTILKMDRNVGRVDANLLLLLQGVNNLSQAYLPQALFRQLQSNPSVDRRTGKVSPLFGESVTQEVDGQDMLQPSATSQHTFPEKATSTSVIKPKKVLKVMRYDQISPVLDIEHCLELADAMEPTDIDRASWVMGAEEFHSWLNEPKNCRSILINGNSDPLEITSPLSLLCAHLTHLFVAAKPVFVVSYFCGLHMDLVTDYRANAQGMMISLIGQLLLQAKQKNVHFDLSFLAQKKLQLLAVDDLKTLCNIFRNLVVQLPKDKIILCIIDGISLYESTDGDADLLYAWQRLNQLLAHKHLKAVMKLLATSPGQTLRLHEEDLMMNGDVLFVPEEVDGNRQGAWNSADIDDSLEQSFSSQRV
ncbi:MAG: hypothetical protein Q9161_009113 [Pseudevernia consocians]